MSHLSISSAACRTQAAYHRNRAAVATLANVRTISASAATAWAREALLAEKREARVEKFRPMAALADLPSENPDRGRADSPTAHLSKNEAGSVLRESLAGWENEGGAS